MSSERQRLANRENAKKSCGPRCTERTRFNAVKHGLRAKILFLPGEDPQDYAEMVEAYQRPMQATR